MVTRTSIVVALCAAGLGLACVPKSHYAIVGGYRSFKLPPEMVPPQNGAKEPPQGQPYTVRMAEGGRVWVAELPQTPGPFEMTIPLEAAPATARAPLGQKPGAAPQMAAAVDPQTEAEAKVQRYLLSVARVKDLASVGRNELALVVLDEVLKEHPKDERLWLMKGTLFRKSGQPARAKEAWTTAQQLAPSDPEVAEALRSLSEEELP